jgi:hypothetical protein
MKLTLRYLAGAALSIAFITSVGHAIIRPPSTIQQQFQSPKDTFTCEITRNPNNRDTMSYILYDEGRNTNYFLDDSKNLLSYDGSYDGHKVEITGTVDPADHTIRMESIRELN